jgi:phage tail sheath protein FI
VGRLALFLEQSLYRGMKWVVFEPTTSRSGRRSASRWAPSCTLFRHGAFRGTTPREAYSSRATRRRPQNNVDKGIVYILVGFAPLKAAEFVIIRIQELAGRIET